LPNMITIGRLFLIPPTVMLLGDGDPFMNLYACLVFLLASLLDVVDGWLARRQNLVTFFGKFVDPLADKVMVMSVLVFLVAYGRLGPTIVVLIVFREFYISGIRMLALRDRIEIVAGAGGKFKTGLQLIGIALMLIQFTYRDPLWGLSYDTQAIGLTLLWISVVFSLTSAIAYTSKYLRGLDRAG
jgi:CDP-diacylglycerol--glycerol-3-phosphate 3-phosphatidyltransferase